MPEVNCTVCNCDFWTQGNLCSADSILITAGTPRGADPFGENAAILPGTAVGAAQDSYCLTFRSRADAMLEEEDEVEAAAAVPPLI